MGIRFGRCGCRCGFRFRVAFFHVVVISNVVVGGACGRKTQRVQDAAFIRHVFPNTGQHGDRCTHGDGITGFDQSPPQNGLFLGFDVDIRLLGFHRGDGRARGDGATHR